MTCGASYLGQSTPRARQIRHVLRQLTCSRVNCQKVMRRLMGQNRHTA